MSSDTSTDSPAQPAQRHQRDDLREPFTAEGSFEPVSCPTTSRHRDFDVGRARRDLAQARVQRRHETGLKQAPLSAGRQLVGRMIAVLIAMVLAFEVMLRLSILLLSSDGPAQRPILTQGAVVMPDVARFALNAFLVPALDPDALPLRWVDPAPIAGCGPGTAVLVDGAPLVAGAEVPFGPFELEWHADGCRPFGKAGPRFDGQLSLTVYREDWGFSAMIAPTMIAPTTAAADERGGMRVTMPGSLTRLIPPDAVFTPVTSPSLPGTTNHALQ